MTNHNKRFSFSHYVTSMLNIVAVTAIFTWVPLLSRDTDVNRPTVAELQTKCRQRYIRALLFLADHNVILPNHVAGVARSYRDHPFFEVQENFYCLMRQLPHAGEHHRAYMQRLSEVSASPE